MTRGALFGDIADNSALARASFELNSVMASVSGGDPWQGLKNAVPWPRSRAANANCSQIDRWVAGTKAGHDGIEGGKYVEDFTSPSPALLPFSALRRG